VNRLTEEGDKETLQEGVLLHVPEQSVAHEQLVSPLLQELSPQYGPGGGLQAPQSV